MIKNKHNWIAEISCICKVLKPMLGCIKTHNPSNEDTEIGLEKLQHDIPTKSATYYKKLQSKLVERPVAEKRWSHILNNIEIDFDKCYRNKVQTIPEKKIAEFNFKVLHYILSCGENLLKWKKQSSDKCINCDECETISHMIFECRYIYDTWMDIKRNLGWDIDKMVIITGNNGDKHENFCISVVAYLIYKRWILIKNDLLKPDLNNIRQFLKEEISLRIQIYSKLKLSDIVNHMSRIRDSLIPVR